MPPAGIVDAGLIVAIPLGRGRRPPATASATENTRAQPGSHEEVTALRRYFASQN